MKVDQRPWLHNGSTLTEACEVIPTDAFPMNKTNHINICTIISASDQITLPYSRSYFFLYMSSHPLWLHPWLRASCSLFDATNAMRMADKHTHTHYIRQQTQWTQMWSTHIFRTTDKKLVHLYENDKNVLDNNNNNTVHSGKKSIGGCFDVCVWVYDNVYISELNTFLYCRYVDDALLPHQIDEYIIKCQAPHEQQHYVVVHEQ